ncbi:hypothetical protein SY83_07765 [Paenibacillus swuensis]|uniref:Uncharacterized protein n=1 Tax=Paenibacillus swuensis TaxID=1178515 RepID=A0A172TH25_9BACL|nr:hypothetical protein [Paenibacillus swuensis]ANE46184.1 hypothetical protein SY83_07765 [Paenibacillus swuensis]
MSQYLKLLHMEIHRFRYMLAGLVGLIIVCQFGALIIWITSQLNDIKLDGFISENRPRNTGYFPDERLSFTEAVHSSYNIYFLPIMICAAVLILYVFVIWYRDWSGKSTFIYQLLMLPQSRHTLYWSKLTAILVFVFGLLAVQLLLLVAQEWLFNWMVPSDLRIPSFFADIIAADPVFSIFLPSEIEQFFISYGLGILLIIIIFTVILIERSYRKIGVLYGLVYLVVVAVILLYPLFRLGLTAYLYPHEIIYMELTLLVLVCIGSLWFSFRLLNNKITV